MATRVEPVAETVGLAPRPNVGDRLLDEWPRELPVEFGTCRMHDLQAEGLLG